MAKGGKSSASSATRKKHARKAAQGEDQLPLPKEKRPKGEKKGSKKNKEPRKKVYIPPVKPAPVQPDPLDTLGIAQRLPAEFLVVLRRLAKKDSITKRRALEEIQTEWVAKAKTGEEVVHALVEAIPVWFHHLPVLFLHPSRRIRLLAVGLHTSLFELPSPVPDQLLFYLQEVADADQAEHILGAWRLVAHDADRQVSLYARQCWDRYVAVTKEPVSHGLEIKLMKISLDEPSFTRIWSFIQRVLLDPLGVYRYFNPPQPAALPPSPHPGQRKGGGRQSSSQPVRKVQEDEPSGRVKHEEDEENDSDRSARLRIGAFGAAEWVLNTFETILAEPTSKAVDSINPLDNLALWSSLYYGQTAPFLQGADIESFGFGQPAVRRSAWNLLQAVLKVPKEQLQPLLPTLSSVILRSAWVEVDAGVRNVLWQPLLTFLKEYPKAWELEASSSAEPEDDGSDSEDDEDIDAKSKKPSVVPAPASPKASLAYQEFLQFLQLGCSGSPSQGYPAVLIILSTIPPSIMALEAAPLATLFTSFWAAVDGRALAITGGLERDRLAASAAFLSSVLECTVFMVRRLVSSEEVARMLDSECENPNEAARELVKTQFSRAWSELLGEKIKIGDEVAAKIIAKTLEDLNRLNQDFFNVAWNIMATSIHAQVLAENKAIPAIVPSLLKTFEVHFASDPQSHTFVSSKTLTGNVVRSVMKQFELVLQADPASVNADRVSSLVAMLGSFGAELFKDDQLAEFIDTAMLEHTWSILNVSLPLIRIYLSHRGDQALCVKVWQAVLRTIASHRDSPSSTAILVDLLDAATAGSLPPDLHPEGDPLESWVGTLLADAMINGGETGTFFVTKKLLQSPDAFISDNRFNGLVSTICSTFAAHAQNALQDDSVQLSSLESPLSLITAVHDRHGIPSDIALSVMPEVFLFGSLVPTFRDMPTTQKETARKLWTTWLSKAEEEVKLDVIAIVKERLRDILTDCSILPSSLSVLQVCSTLPQVDVMQDIFPQRKEFDAMLDVLPSYPSDSSLAALDPLILPGSFEVDASDFKPIVDRSGLSAYGRITTALLSYFTEDRLASKANIWALRHLLALALYSDEIVHSPASGSAVFGKPIHIGYLQEITAKVKQVTAYILSSTLEEGWLAATASALLSGNAPRSEDGVAQLLHDIIRDPQNRDTIREARMIHVLLQHILSNATKAEADQFIMLARRIETKAPHISLAIVLSVTRYAPEPPRLDRYRNELAAGFLAIPASKANTEGLWSLRRLAATAPDPESDVIFLPTPRAVNFMKSCQQWISSDEDIDEEVEGEMTLLFTHLAPILQNVPGAHWDFIFDVLENNLENCSFSEPSTLCTLSRSLRLFMMIQDLASTNKALKAVWQERQTTNLTLIRDLMTSKSDGTSTSSPLSLCRELAISIIQDLPESLISQNTLADMCHLITDPSPSVQTMAYHLLREAASKRTEYLVVEAAMDSEEPIKPTLPMELVEILQRGQYHEEEPEELQATYGNLLAWMLVFDLFTNASLKVKSGYIDHFKDLGLIAERFLPQILGSLGLYGGIVKAFKLDIWTVEDFYLDFFDPEVPQSFQLLAAHLYYRALLIVPSLFRSWLLDCRDKQLYSAVTTYTSTHFSPAIIRTELALVKDPTAAADLADENLKVKVANAINEVTASYAVDEYQLELKLKLPSDWPLHTIEVKDTNRIGVTEDRWRAWILGVQQILTFRSGSIIDGLSFFKKNVVSHFEGQSECAICYSMISAMDGSLPKKPCKTCKNRFHAGCLYKWFNTSHSSSCPLCRSEIMQ